MENKYKVCLCMIVKNEAHVIKRCLDSAKNFIDYWIINDTGSTDNTKQVIADTMKGIPGEIHDIPWKNFGFNRSETLRLSKEKSDYSLVMDADEFLVFEDGFNKEEFKKSLFNDLYDVKFKNGNINYIRAVLTKNSLNWGYRGVLHEFPQSELPVNSRSIAKGLYQSTFSDGARSKDPEKYKKDAEKIKNALEEEKDVFMQRRYTFYLAQCYRDSGNLDLAYENYLKRSNMNGWSEEVFVSLYSAGKIAITLGKNMNEILSLLLKAFSFAPNRIESIHSAVRYLREKNEFAFGYLLSKSVLDMPKPSEGGSLFIEAAVYKYCLLDEHAVCAYHIKKYEECYSACSKILEMNDIPDLIRKRVQENLNFCIGKF